MRFLLVLFLLASASPVSQVANRADILRKSFRSRLLVVYGVDDPSWEARMRDSAQMLAPWRARSVTLASAASVDRDALSRGAVAVVGTAASNRWMVEMARALPLRFQEGGFVVSGTTYDTPGDSVQLLYPNPLCPDQPLFLIAGNSDAAVLDALKRRRRDDLQVRRNGKTLLLGRFRDDWTLDPDNVEAFPWPTEPDLVTRHFEYFRAGAGVGAAELEELAQQNETTRDRIEAWFGHLAEVSPTAVYVYPTLERKGLVTESTEPAHAEGGTVHVVLGLDRSPERLVAETLLGSVVPGDLPPALIQGLATVLVDGEAALDERDRLARGLMATSEPPRLASLDGESSLVVDAVSASFARFLLAERGPKAFREKLELAPLEERWLAALHKKSFSPAPFPAVPASFQRGFTYSQEGFDIHNGYLSSASDRSLAKLASLGVDSIAVVPYAFMSGPSSAELSIPDGPGAETDEGVIHVIRAAKRNGMTVLLKPQIWVRRSWPGEIEPRDPEDEERFFHEYARWIRHYALMAEENGVPILSIGCELARLTHGRRALWESLIRDLRAVYRGKLVYSANWGEEVDRVDFWPLLDYIGVDFYYPLSDEQAPSDGDLRRGIEHALAGLHALSAREGKPVLLTEIGYTSTATPWKSPHESDRDQQSSPVAQARVYDVAFAAVAGETSWIRGMYWWKWPSDLDRGGPGDNGFTPNGKPAEEVVRRWYRGRLQ